MKQQQLGLLSILLITIIMVFSCTSKSEKNKWAKEAPETKYSKARENEVWGEVLLGRNPALYYGTHLYDLAETLSRAIWFRNNEEIEKLIDAIPHI